MRRVVEDHPMALGKAEVGRQRILTQYSWANATRGVERACHSLLADCAVPADSGITENVLDDIAATAIDPLLPLAETCVAGAVMVAVSVEPRANPDGVNPWHDTFTK